MDGNKILVPCVCKNISFYKINKTISYINQISEKKKRKHDEKVYSIERVDLGKGCSYCRPCFEKWSNITDNISKK